MTTRTPGETTTEKAHRLIREKRVHYQQTLPDRSMVYWIDGDSGRTRIVTLDPEGQTTCDCPALIPDCAHAQAVTALYRADDPGPSPGTVLSPDAPIETIPIPGHRQKQPDRSLIATLEGGKPDNDEDDEDDDEPPQVVGDDGPMPVVADEQRRDLIDLATAPVTWRTLETISRTEFVPAALRGKPAACLAAILTGRELGIGPMTSLRQIAVIDGSPTLSAELMLKLYRQAGHRLDIRQADDREVSLTGTRGDTGETMDVSFTLDDALRAGLITVDENGEVRARSQRGRPLPWETYTPDLLWARAVSRLVRRLAPDLTETEASP